MRFGISADGQPGYITTDGDGADAVIPFNNGGSSYILVKVVSESTRYRLVQHAVGIAKDYFSSSFDDYDKPIGSNTGSNAVTLTVLKECRCKINFAKTCTGGMGGTFTLQLNGSTILTSATGGTQNAQTLEIDLAEGDIITSPSTGAEDLCLVLTLDVI